MSEEAVITNSSVQDQTWSIQYAGNVYGPYSRNDMLKLILSKQLNARAKIKRADWKEYSSILDCLEMLAKNPASQQSDAKQAERRMAAPRSPVEGIASVSNDAATIDALTSNISTTGIFVKTGETVFRIGDQVDIAAKISQIPKPFRVKAEIMRFSSNLKFGVGYGMRFLEIDNLIVAEISKVVGVRPISEFGEIFTQPALKPVPK